MAIENRCLGMLVAMAYFLQRSCVIDIDVVVVIVVVVIVVVVVVVLDS